MHLTQEQRLAVMRRVEELVQKANSLYGSNWDGPAVRFDKRGTCGGTAMGDFEINLNAGLMVDHWDEYMEQTIPHEVAHCVVNHVWGAETRRTRTGRRQRISHGPRWKGVMRDFGVEAKRTHDMDVSKVRQGRRTKTKYEYVCQNCGAHVPVGPKYHKDLQRGRKLMHKCAGRGQRGDLVFSGVLGQVTYAEAAQNKAPEPKKAPKPAPRATAPRSGSQIGRAVDIYGQCQLQGITARQDIMKQIMALMSVDKGKAAQLHDRAKKKVAA